MAINLNTSHADKTSHLFLGGEIFGGRPKRCPKRKRMEEEIRDTFLRKCPGIVLWQKIPRKRNGNVLDSFSEQTSVTIEKKKIWGRLQVLLGIWQPHIRDRRDYPFSSSAGSTFVLLTFFERYGSIVLWWADNISLFFILPIFLNFTCPPRAITTVYYFIIYIRTMVIYFYKQPMVKPSLFPKKKPLGR